MLADTPDRMNEDELKNICGRGESVGQVVAVVDLGWVDVDFEHSTTCPILLGHLEVWQNGLLSWAR